MTVEGTGQLPKSIILGMTIGQWPVQAFTAEAHALDWIARDTDLRRLWRCTLVDPVELEYVPPGEARLVEKGESVG